MCSQREQEPLMGSLASRGPAVLACGVKIQPMPNRTNSQSQRADPAAWGSKDSMQTALSPWSLLRHPPSCSPTPVTHSGHPNTQLLSPYQKTPCARWRDGTPLSSTSPSTAGLALPCLHVHAGLETNDGNSCQASGKSEPVLITEHLCK